MKAKAAMRYCISDDGSGHKYVIPYERTQEWESWIYSQAWENGDPPDYAERIDGGTLTFTDWRIER